MKQVQDLITLLENAYEQLLEYEGGYSENFIFIEEFQKALNAAILELKRNNLEVLNDLLIWFSPSYDWDDFGGDVDLGNQIYSKIREILGGFPS